MSDFRRPAFQWYPGDHRRDPAIQACSFEAEALWRRMLDLMHDGEPYGHLTASTGEPIGARELARMCGISAARVTRYLNELERWGVFSRTDSEVIYSRRMVKDNRIRLIRAAAGKLGGNPNLRPNHTDNQPVKRVVKQNGKQKPTPSVAVAVSPSGTTPPVVPHGGPEEKPEGKPGTNGKKPKKRQLTPTPDEQAVLDHFVSLHPRARPGDAEIRKIRAALGRGSTPEELIAAIEGNHIDPWCVEHGKHELVYILQSDSLITRFLELAERDLGSVANGEPTAEECRRLWLEHGFTRNTSLDELRAMAQRLAEQGTIRNADRFFAITVAVRPWTWLHQERVGQERQSVERIAAAMRERPEPAPAERG